MNPQNILSLLASCAVFALLGYLGTGNLVRHSGGKPTAKRCSLLGGLTSFALVVVTVAATAVDPTKHLDWTRCAVIAVGASTIAAVLGYYFPGEKSAAK